MWLAGLLVVGTVVFSALKTSGSLTARSGSNPQPAFSPLLYTLDLLLPVVNLKQRDSWVSVTVGAQAAVAVFVILGWAIATAVVAALSGLLKKT